MPKSTTPFTPILTHSFRIDVMFSGVSLMKGNMGVSQTTVGMPLSPIRSSTSIRRRVLHTFGSRIRHSASS